MKHSYKTGS